MYLRNHARPNNRYCLQGFEDIIEFIASRHSAASCSVWHRTTAPPHKTTMTSNGWTDAEDRALEAGLAQHPSSMDKNERWTLIAAGVPNRSKKECVARFKEIRQALLSKQQQQQQQQQQRQQQVDSAGAGRAGIFKAESAAEDQSPNKSQNNNDSKAPITILKRREGGDAAAEPALLIPGQAVTKTNHRRASGASDNDNGSRNADDAGGNIGTAKSNAGTKEFVLPSSNNAGDSGTEKQGKDKKSRDRGRGKAKGKNNDPSEMGVKDNVKEQKEKSQQQNKGNKKKSTKKQNQQQQKQQSAKGQGSGEKSKKGGAPAKAKKKRNRAKKKGKFAWRNDVPAGAVDPISLDPLVDLPYPPFALVATAPYDVIQKWPVTEEEERKMDLLRSGTEASAESATESDEEERRRIAERELDVIREQWGDAVAASASAFSQQKAASTWADNDGGGSKDDTKSTLASTIGDGADGEVDKESSGIGSSRRYYHLFDGRVLAYYLVSQLQFIDPLNRRDLTRPELLNLDEYLERHNLGRAGVTEAYDGRGVTVSTAGVGGQTAEGRAEILQQEARTLLGSLFSGESHADGSAAAQRQMEARARATPRFQNEFQRHYEESERRHQGARGCGQQQREGSDQAQDAGVYTAEEGGILLIDDDVNPGLRGGIGAASDSARRHEETSGRRGNGTGRGSSAGPNTLWSSTHIADQYGHASRVRAENFPSLQVAPKKDEASSSNDPVKPTGPSKSLLKISQVVKKTDPKQAVKQKQATEEARRRAALANVSFQVRGSQSTSVGGDGIGAAMSAVQAVPSAGVPQEPTQGQLQRNRAMASALGVQPATIRNNFNSGWARPTTAAIETDEFGNELNAAQYPDALIVEAKERMAELLKLEKRWKTFLADDKASSNPLRAMPRDLRKFVHEYSDFWNLHTESFDPEPRRYIHCTKMVATSVPHPLLSEAVRKWKGPGSGAPALPVVNRSQPHSNLQQPQSLLSAGQSATAAREFTITEQRKPLKLEPRSVPSGYVAPSMAMSPRAMFDNSDNVTTNNAQLEEGVGSDRQPAERFSSLLAERPERPKLSLAPRTKPLDLPAYQPDQKKSYDIAKARERMEREKKEKLDKQQKEKETAQNILASAFASDSSDDDANSNDSSDWGEDQEAVFDGSDEEW